jgi:hypothetical protein|tara:strand:+ start:9366 stop:9557 length:192 start_codon:yes stop_codon:yes gene_type:complete
MEKTLTKEQVNRKYKGRYIEMREKPSYLTESGKTEYEIIRTYKEIHENTTLGEDVGTEMEYRR